MKDVEGTKLHMQLKFGQPSIYPIDLDQGMMIELRRYPNLMLVQIRLLQYQPSTNTPTELVCWPSPNHWHSGILGQREYVKIIEILIDHDLQRRSDEVITTFMRVLSEDTQRRISKN